MRCLGAQDFSESSFKSTLRRNFANLRKNKGKFNQAFFSSRTISSSPPLGMSEAEVVHVGGPVARARS